MQGDDPAGQVAESDVIPARPSGSAAQRQLVGPGTDRLGEVDVRLRDRRLPAGRRRAAPASGSRCTTIRHGRQVGCENSQTSRRPPCRVTRSISARADVDVDDVAQPERDRHGVERPVGEGQPGGISGDEPQIGPPGPAHPQHAEREVAGDGQRAGSRRTARWRCRCRPARSSTRSPGRRSSACQTARRQRPVLAERQHVVGPVVTLGDVVEHRRDLVRLLVQAGTGHLRIVPDRRKHPPATPQPQPSGRPRPGPPRPDRPRPRGLV